MADERSFIMVKPGAAWEGLRRPRGPPSHRARRRSARVDAPGAPVAAGRIRLRAAVGRRAPAAAVPGGVPAAAAAAASDRGDRPHIVLERSHRLRAIDPPPPGADGVQRGLVGEVIKRFEQRGYTLRGLKVTGAALGRGRRALGRASRCPAARPRRAPRALGMRGARRAAR
jgi:hypothetical protein